MRGAASPQTAGIWRPPRWSLIRRPINQGEVQDRVSGTRHGKPREEEGKAGSQMVAIRGLKPGLPGCHHADGGHGEARAPALSMKHLLFRGNQEPGKAQVAPRSPALSTLTCCLGPTGATALQEIKRNATSALQFGLSAPLPLTEPSCVTRASGILPRAEARLPSGTYTAHREAREKALKRGR